MGDVRPMGVPDGQARRRAEQQPPSMRHGPVKLRNGCGAGVPRSTRDRRRHCAVRRQGRRRRAQLDHACHRSLASCEHRGAPTAHALSWNDREQAPRSAAHDVPAGRVVSDGCQPGAACRTDDAHELEHTARAELAAPSRPRRGNGAAHSLAASGKGPSFRIPIQRPQRDSNPRRRRERAVSWASRRWGQSPWSKRALGRASDY
jgi:hypothetical protein